MGRDVGSLVGRLVEGGEICGRMGLEVGDTVSAGSSVFCSTSGAIGLATGESGGLNVGDSVGDSPLLCVLALGV